MRLKNEKFTKVNVYKFNIDQSNLAPKISDGNISVEIIFKNGKFDEVALPGWLLGKPFTRSHWKIYGDIAKMIERLEDCQATNIDTPVGKYQLEELLAMIYKQDKEVAYLAVANVCDEILDSSGALLGRVRDLVRDF